MPDDVTVSKPKLWCNRLRQFLGLGPPATAQAPTSASQGPNLKGKVSAIAKGLTDLQKELKSGKGGLAAEESAALQAKVGDAAKALKQAAKAKDEAEVDKQQAVLAQLQSAASPAPPAAAPAGDAPPKAPAAKAPKDQAAKDQAAKKEAATKLTAERMAAAQRLLDDLTAHPESVFVSAEVFAATSKLAEAQKKADAGDHAAVKTLLAELSGEIKTAKTVADKQVQFAAMLPGVLAKVADLKAHAHKASITAEIAAVEAKVATAKTKATEQNHDEAMALLTQAGKDCDAADSLANAAAEYNELRPYRVQRINALKTHVGAAGIATQITALEAKLAAAATKATARDFGAAVTLLKAIPKDCDEAAFIAGKYDNYVTYLPPVQQVVTDLKAHPGKAAATAEIAALDASLTAAKAKFAAKDYPPAVQLLLDVWNGREAPKKAADELAKYTTDLAPAEAKVTALKGHAQKAVVAAEIAAIETKLTQAKTNATAGNHDTAVSLLAEVVADCLAATAIADRQAAYAALLAAAEAEVKVLKEHAQKDAVKGEATAAEAKLGQARTKAAAKDFDGAEALIAEALTICLSAKEIADRQATFATGQATAQTAVNDFEKDPAKAMEAAQKLLDQLKAHAQAAAIATQTKAIQKKIGEAQKKLNGGKPEEADALVVAAVADCGAASLIAVRHEQYAALRTTVQTKVTALKAHAQKAAIAAQITALDAKLAEAKAKADASDQVAGIAILQSADQDADTAKTNADQHVAFLAALPGAEAQVTALDGLAQKAAILPEITELKGKITTAKAKAAAHDYGAAMAIIGAIPAESTAARLLADACANAKRRLKDWAEDLVTALKAHAQKAAITTEIAAIDAKIVQIKAKITARTYKAAESLAGETYWDCKAAETIANQAAPYAAALPGATAKIATLTGHAQKAAIATEIAAVEAKLTQAKAQATAKAYPAALGLLTEIGKDCDTAKILADKQATYETERTKVDDKVKALQGHLELPAAASQMAAIDNKLAAAKTAAEARDLDGAIALLAEALALGALAQAAIDRQAEFTAAAVTAGSVLTDASPATEIADAIKATRALLKKLTGHAQASRIAEQTAEIKTQLDLAASELKAKKPAEARAALEKASALCGDANSNLEAQAYLALRKTAVETLLTGLKGHAHKSVIKSELAGVEGKVAEAETAAASGKTNAGLARLDEASDICGAAQALLDQHTLYAAQRPPLEGLLQALKSHDQKYAIGLEIVAVETSLAEAKSKAEDKDYDKALELLKKAGRECDLAKVKADMSGNNEPSAADLQKIADQPGGEEALDKMVEALGPQTNRKVLAAVIKARFGVQLDVLKADKTAEDMTKRAPNLRRIYEMMTLVPDSHAADNPKLKKITRYGGSPSDSGESSSYSSADGVVVLSCGRVGDRDETTLGDPKEVPGVEERCKPKDNKKPSYFNWTTLHEVGHAVDDKHGFMKSKGSGDDYGGWAEYGRNAGPVAAAAAKEFKFDAAYIEEFLAGGTPKLPKPKAGTSDEDWQKAKVLAEEWCQAIKVGKSLWDNGAEAAARAIGGRVYQESYADVWTSYKLDARKRGLTGYQFRAPAEWFAELYAGFHSDKLKNNHPAMPWLKTL